jgi:hypothetical protein
MGVGSVIGKHIERPDTVTFRHPHGASCQGIHFLPSDSHHPEIQQGDETPTQIVAKNLAHNERRLKINDYLCKK